MANTHNEQIGILEGDRKQRDRGKLMSVTIDFAENGAVVRASYEKGSISNRPIICKTPTELSAKIEEFASQAGMTERASEERPKAEPKVAPESPQEEGAEEPESSEEET